MKLGRTCCVIDSILGVGIGTSFNQAHAKLDHLGKREKKSNREEPENEEVTKRCGL
jgi:hypothetical protein